MMSRYANQIGKNSRMTAATITVYLLIGVSCAPSAPQQLCAKSTHILASTLHASLSCLQ